MINLDNRLRAAAYNMHVIDESLKATISHLQKLKTGTVFDLINSDIPPVQYHIDEIIPKSMITVLFGEGESFKSGLSLHIALALATGKDTFFFKNRNKGKVKVLWIDEEMGVIGLKQKIIKLMVGMDIKPVDIKDTFIYRSMTGFKIDNKSTKGNLTNFIFEENPKIIIIDSLSRCMEGEENNVTDIRKVHSSLRSIQADTAVTFVIIHHITKNKQKLSLQSLRGSGDIGNQVDMAIGMQRTAGDKFFLGRYKWRYREKNFTPINFMVSDVENGMKLLYAGTVGDNVAKKIALHIRDWINHNPQETYQWSEILEEMKERKFKESSIVQGRKLLEDAKFIKKVGHGAYKYVEVNIVNK